MNPVQRIGAQIAEAITTHRQADEREAMVRAGDLLEQVGLPGRRIDDYPHELSGGQKQRVMIATALACSPSLIIADEPTTALDVMVQAQVLKLLKRLQRSSGWRCCSSRTTYRSSSRSPTGWRSCTRARSSRRGRRNASSPARTPVHEGTGGFLPADRGPAVPQERSTGSGRPA